MVYGVIYKYTSPSGGIYIGQTVNIDKRKKQHIYDVNHGSNRKFHNAIRKHGIDTFTFEILHPAFLMDELNELEKYYIEYYNSYYKNGNGGYNMTIGGEGANGYQFTDSDKRKLSESLKTYFSNNPTALKEMSVRTKEYNQKHPGKIENHIIFMKYHANLPENKEKSKNTFEKFREENPEAISNQQIDIWKREGHKEKMSKIQKEYLENYPEAKQKRIDNLMEYRLEHKDEISKRSKDNASKPENKEKFKNIMKTDRKNHPEKYEKANQKRKENANTLEFKENMSMKKRKILNMFEVFDNDNKLLGEFNNTIDCIQFLKLQKPPSIKLCLDNKILQSGGYKFRYKIEEYVA